MAQVRVFFADDDDDDREFIRDAFTAIDRADILHEFTDGRKLLDALTSEKDISNIVVLLDLNMPFMDGYEVLKEIRITFGWKDLPVILFTTSVTEHDRQRCIELGCTEFLNKPVEYNLYVEIAKRLVNTYAGAAPATL